MIANLLPEQAANLIGISKSTLAKLRLSGEGPKFLRIGKRRIAYRPEDIEDWQRERTFSSTSEYIS